jgi:o-succinylbenzoate synthase
MKLRSATLDELELPLVEPFETSFGVETTRRFLLLRLESTDGLVGFGECAASTEPLYSGESIDSAREILLRHLLPPILRAPSVTADGFRTSTARFRANRMAKSTVETALMDLEGKSRGRSVAALLGGGRARIEVGVSVGIQPTVAALVRRVGAYLDAGYRRVKLKVRPGWDVRPLRAVRAAYPDLEIWVDANQAYPPVAVDRIRGWAERFGVAQVEQPFPERAVRAHARLADGARFRVCLDETIVDDISLDDALEARALSSLNVKTARVGGVVPGRALARTAAKAGVPAWVGGMLESGVGRAHNVQLASLPVFSLPGDLSASDRYYREEIVDPPFVLGPGSSLAVPRGPGIGVEVREDAVRRARRASKVLRRP